MTPSCMIPLEGSLTRKGIRPVVKIATPRTQPLTLQSAAVFSLRATACNLQHSIASFEGKPAPTIAGEVHLHDPFFLNGYRKE